MRSNLPRFGSPLTFRRAFRAPPPHFTSPAPVLSFLLRQLTPTSFTVQFLWLGSRSVGEKSGLRSTVTLTGSPELVKTLGGKRREKLVCFPTKEARMCLFITTTLFIAIMSANQIIMSKFVKLTSCQLLKWYYKCDMWKRENPDSPHEWKCPVIVARIISSKISQQHRLRFTLCWPNGFLWLCRHFGWQPSVWHFNLLHLINTADP